MVVFADSIKRHISEAVGGFRKGWRARAHLHTRLTWLQASLKTKTDSNPHMALKALSTAVDLLGQKDRNSVLNALFKLIRVHAER